jgi:hypothetical protein
VDVYRQPRAFFDRDIFEDWFETTFIPDVARRREHFSYEGPLFLLRDNWAFRREISPPLQSLPRQTLISATAFLRPTPDLGLADLRPDSAIDPTDQPPRVHQQSERPSEVVVRHFNVDETRIGGKHGLMTGAQSWFDRNASVAFVSEIIHVLGRLTLAVCRQGIEQDLLEIGG